MQQVHVGASWGASSGQWGSKFGFSNSSWNPSACQDVPELMTARGNPGIATELVTGAIEKEACPVRVRHWEAKPQTDDGSQEGFAA